MRVEWHGQSAFTLTADGTKVFIDPFGDMSALARDRGMQWEYPPIGVGDVDLLLITHEHVDHNGTDGIAGDPAVLRSTAGTLESPIGEVVAVASEHDDAAGTERGPNTIFAFDLDGLRVAHFGDFGQSRLRPEQAAALQGTDLIFLPIGGGGYSQYHYYYGGSVGPGGRMSGGSIAAPSAKVTVRTPGGKTVQRGGFGVSGGGKSGGS
jgi:L-ascorbate metabolism protein UlaG (beta-lactamase superfamily)